MFPVIDNPLDSSMGFKHESDGQPPITLPNAPNPRPSLSASRAIETSSIGFSPSPSPTAEAIYAAYPRDSEQESDDDRPLATPPSAFSPTLSRLDSPISDAANHSYSPPRSPPADAFYTATPGYGASYVTPGRLEPDSEFGRALSKKNLLVAKEVEINWSGRGQNVVFEPGEAVPLEVEKSIGHSSTALVESVRCRRIRLARKSIRIHRRVTFESLLDEVAYLHKLRHPHVVQLIGTYVQKNIFALLLYPVATGDLTKFLDEWEPTYAVLSRSMPVSPVERMQLDLTRFFLCLADAIEYMHGEGIKHMDIKPSNILVNERSQLNRPTVRSVYLTDFGISRSFTVNEDSKTDDPTSMTKRWCSPEVATQGTHGRASDIFSLGCVFIEMYTVLLRFRSADFEDYRAQDGGNDYFYEKLPRVREWISKLRDAQTPPQTRVDKHPFEPDTPPMYAYNNPRRESVQLPPLGFLDLIEEMISERPQDRPTSAVLCESLDALKLDLPRGHVWDRPKRLLCCKQERETYRVAEDDELTDAFEFTEWED